ncbi:MAG: glycerol kinase GlpK [Alphaproteobacteria bacterium]|jgi:glycerol kinase|nr:glycerol kinase GlpK [Alphaproteobacteria bacterium]
MARNRALLAIDQGTTSSRAIVFDRDGRPLATAQRELPQIFPAPGLVEHDPDRIWRDSLAVARDAIAQSGLDAVEIAAIGITNQRETTVIWDRRTGAPIHNAIVWQDRRTAELCRRLRDDGRQPLIQERTGLVIDPYFSGSKIAWLLDNVDGARAAAGRGELAFGTIDSWLLWQLTGGGVHATDATNASRTMLFDIHRQAWDDELCALLDIPTSLLPEVRDSSGHFGDTAEGLFERPIAIGGIAGDQQAATVGQACFGQGMVKSTYGTGCFVMMNTGEQAIPSQNQLLTTVAYRIGGQVTYALEGSIFVAGAAVQWLRDGLNLIAAAPDSEALAREIDSTGGVYLVPAFAGLGAPYWDAEARGAILGLTRDTGIAQIVRAALEAVCYQTQDLLQAMQADAGAPIELLRVDGGMVENDWLMQFLADVVDRRVDRPAVTETTALGAAYLAGLQAGIYGGLDEVAAHWRHQASFSPSMAAERRHELYEAWEDAVARVRTAK